MSERGGPLSHPDADAVSASSPLTERGSGERFGFEWKTYAQLLPMYEEQFRRWTAPLPPDAWKGKRVLDVGCGMGRNSYWAMSYGAVGGLAIDIDERSLASARSNLASFPALEVRHLSAYELGAQHEFDLAFSIGVIHHLEAPERALAAMHRAIKPGGVGLIWVYGRENNGWIVHVFDPLRRSLFSRLPIRVLHELSLAPTIVLWAALRLGFGRLEYHRLLRRLSFGHLRSIVFDHMLPRIARYWRREEVERLMADAGFVDVQATHVNGMSWSALGRKHDPAGCR